MDSGFWTSRLAAAKRQSLYQHHHSDRLGIDDFDLEDEARPDYPYLYSYEDFDIASPGSHLKDEHSYESKVMICPVYSVKVAQDMLSHIRQEHGHLFKLQRRRRLRRLAIPNSQALSLLGRDLRGAHLQVLLGGGGGGGGGYRSNHANVSNAVTDPLLSSLILNFPAPETEEISKSAVAVADDSAPSHIWKSSFDPCLSTEERDRRIRQAAGRSGFVQDLFLTTLLGE